MLQVLTGTPHLGDVVAWINRDEQDPEQWFVESGGPVFTRITDRLPRDAAKDHQRRSFCVPTAALMGVVATPRPAAREPRRAAPTPARDRMDPPGLESARTVSELVTLAESLGMDDRRLSHLIELLNTAPNAGQRVMRGRNAIRNFLKGVSK